MIMLYDHFLFLFKLLVPFLAFTFVLLHLKRPVCDLFLKSIDVSLEIVYSLARLLVVLE